jgi:hypothetical protein
LSAELSCLHEKVMPKCSLSYLKTTKVLIEGVYRSYYL